MCPTDVSRGPLASCSTGFPTGARQHPGSESMTYDRQSCGAELNKWLDHGMHHEAELVSGACTSLRVTCALASAARSAQNNALTYAQLTSLAHLCSLSLALAGVIGSGTGSGSVKRSCSSLSSAASGSEPYSEDDGGSASKQWHRRGQMRRRGTQGRDRVGIRKLGRRTVADVGQARHC